MGKLASVVAGMFKVGIIGFGGGSALIPVIEKELVDRRRLLSERVFTSHTVIANITPGALPVKLGALAGAHGGSALASVLAALAVAFPGALATVGLIALFSSVGPSAITYVEYAAVGITAFIIVLLIHYITKVLVRAENRPAALVITLIAFLATGANQLVRVTGALFGQEWLVDLPRLSAVQLVVASLVAIGIFSLFSKPVPAQGESLAVPEGARNMASAIWFTVLTGVVIAVAFAFGMGQFMALIGLSTVSSFGGGEAYVGVADGFFVGSGGYVGAQEFYGQVVPVANALPGPILVKVAAALAYFHGLETGGMGAGFLLAITAFLLTVTACSAVAMLVMAGYDKASRSSFIQNLGHYILPVICGLLITTSLSMVLANVQIGSHAEVAPPVMGWATLAGVVVLWWVSVRYEIADVLLLLAGGGISLALLSLLAG